MLTIVFWVAVVGACVSAIRLSAIHIEGPRVYGWSCLRCGLSMAKITRFKAPPRRFPNSVDGTPCPSCVAWMQRRLLMSDLDAE